jgi:hypothetical protein
MIEIRSSETLVRTTAKRRNNPEDGVLQRHRREALQSYIALTGWILYWRRNVSPVKYELGFNRKEKFHIMKCCVSFRSRCLSRSWRRLHGVRII